MLKINKDEIKLIVCDIDGTLITDNKELLPEVKATLLDLQATGVFVSIASGRMPLGFIEYAEELKIKDYGNYVIGANGAVVMNLTTRKNEYSNQMKVPVVQQVTSILLNNNCAFALSYAQDKVLHVAGKHLLAEKLTPGAFLDGMEMVAEFDFNNLQETNKIVVRANSVAEFEQAYQELQTITAINIERLSPTTCDIVNADCNKGTGIAHLIKLLNVHHHLAIKPQNVLYFGDNNNDIAALKYVKYGIAMSHAPSSVLAVAYDTTISNNQAGVSWYLNKLTQQNY
ncbi:Cof-type HAD-IIB family hydrolase [Spiroplasma eriocheiris]|uniref:Cof-like hydrolase n=1 Tax=Spiroplasma eriocheiris TaxID=315358 RepID=A0A0H3XHH5_9MOLU|nr:Cof-type HAD-IIB family hydrolase [Spiroplasma eriocheiris]AHF57262.1 putative haloacid dehalogenase-like hydrolase [Spiroplasma eriocheiris CCTCC M 207170]AKM53725.1 Cof-like hydrolase [Spiroplasma eriocheiris]